MQELLERLADFNPIRHNRSKDAYCIFCKARTAIETKLFPIHNEHTTYIQHKDTCLWGQARQIVGREYPFYIVLSVEIEKL